MAGGALRLVRASDGIEMLKPRLPFCTNTVPAAVQNASSPSPWRCSLPVSLSLGVPILGDGQFRFGFGDPGAVDHFVDDVELNHGYPPSPRIGVPQVIDANGD